MEKNFDLEKISVRPSVYLHARKMESRLREKDKEKGKDGWHDGNLYYYLEKAAGCIQTISEKAEITFTRGGITQKANSDIKEKDIFLAIKKCYDGSNFLMMLADNLRDELLERGIKLHK